VDSLSYPRSAYSSSGSSRGRPGFPPTRGKSRRVGNSWVWSLAFAPAVRMANGTRAAGASRAAVIDTATRRAVTLRLCVMCHFPSGSFHRTTARRVLSSLSWYE
jgi:hypothetical protein